ncbi:MAG: hypothetical protein J6386_05310 [Candidatus Synoicihabitans palmerolidicus]|nr:hypothetical protein [Candidatus Synoicihabitans palmerolidicus]
MMLGKISLRKLSLSIASSDLLADFCGARRIDGQGGLPKKACGSVRPNASPPGRCAG